MMTVPEVGKVHFGVVHVMEAANEDVVGRRSGILGPEFIPIAQAVKDRSGYESWSSFCLEDLDSLLRKAAASGNLNPFGIAACGGSLGGQGRLPEMGGWGLLHGICASPCIADS